MTISLLTIATTETGGLFDDCEPGDYVLMTVEEYRERIATAWDEGYVEGPDGEMRYRDSATKRRLDADLGGEVKP